MGPFVGGIGKPGGYALPFDPSQMQVYAVNRIHLELPILILESENETLPEFDHKETFQYSNEAEATNATNWVGGGIAENTVITPQSVGAPYEERIEQVGRGKAGFNVFITTKTKRSKSVLPIEADIVARLIGPEGVVWSNSYPITVRYVGQGGGVKGGKGMGIAFIDSYTDLNNPLIVFGDQNYTLHLFMSLPTLATTNSQVGQVGEYNSESKTYVFPGSSGRFTCFFRSEDRYVSAP